MGLDRNIDIWLLEYYNSRNENTLNESVRTFKEIHTDKKIEKLNNKLQDIYKAGGKQLTTNGESFVLLSHKNDKKATKLERKIYKLSAKSTAYKPYENCEVGKCFIGMFKETVGINTYIMHTMSFKKVKPKKVGESDEIKSYSFTNINVFNHFSDYYIVGKSKAMMSSCPANIFALLREGKHKPSVVIVSEMNGHSWVERLYAQKPYSKKELEKLSKNTHNSWYTENKE